MKRGSNESWMTLHPCTISRFLRTLGYKYSEELQSRRKSTYVTEVPVYVLGRRKSRFSKSLRFHCPNSDLLVEVKITKRSVWLSL